MLYVGKFCPYLAMFQLTFKVGHYRSILGPATNQRGLNTLSSNVLCAMF